MTTEQAIGQHFRPTSHLFQCDLNARG